MSDPRFARLKTDPRFRRPKKHSSKLVVDDRFKDVFSSSKKSKKPQLVDKYGRSLPKNHEQEKLKKFYQLNGSPDEQADSFPDYARGEVLLESSDEDEDEDEDEHSGDEDDNGIVTVGADPYEDEDADIDLDENRFADLDAQAAAYSKSHPDEEQKSGSQTRRLAIVNLDWDHVRASHLYKILSSVVSPAPSTEGRKPKAVITGKVLSVRVYPSEFGKERLAREEKEGPPPEIFKRSKELAPEQINEKTIYDISNGEEYNEDALRKYQLERLRYYYAVATCDTTETAAHIFNELEGTELERSANVFDLSFVPDDMSFDGEPRDEATDQVSHSYKPVEFVTDALRHSKVKLTWDDDDPERNKVTRRAFSQKEIEEADFRAYIASSGDEDESEDDGKNKKSRKSAEREKLRSLLLGGGDNDLPEGWGDDNAGDDVDMEITFTPGLSDAKDGQDETTLEQYQRKLREKKKQRKEKLKGRKEEQSAPTDDFFGAESDEDAVDPTKKTGSSSNGKGRDISTAEELSLLAVSDQPEPSHFNMKSVIKAEKGKKSKKKKKALEVDAELQTDFAIDVKDTRFDALHEDHTFAIDPSNPHFKKTKSMSALLSERSKRHQSKLKDDAIAKEPADQKTGSDLQALVDRVKRKSSTSSSQKSKRRKQ